MSAVLLIIVRLGVPPATYCARVEAAADRGQDHPAATRILFPFVGESLSTPAFDAALRIARAEGATLVPAYLAIVPLSVQLDTPLEEAGGGRAAHARGDRAAGRHAGRAG